MTPQKPRKTVSPWEQCESCLTSLQHKDTNFHTSDCPPDLENITYNFIKEGVLFGTVDLKTNEEIKNLSSRERDNLVFLSESVIRLCSLAIGEYVLVRSVNKDLPPVARIVWPTVEKTLTSVLFTKNGLEVSSFGINQIVAVSKLPNHLNSANTITIVALNGPKSMEITSELYNRISKSYEGRFITIGNVINVMFYGKQLKFKVESIKAKNTNCNDLYNNFSRMTIEEIYEFAEVRSDTKWVLYRDNDEYMTKVSENESSTSLAGVDEEMDEIRILMKSCLERSDTARAARTNAVLLFGNSGTGKTTIATTLAKESEVHVVNISSTHLFGNSTITPEDSLRDLIKNAFECTPSIILIDEIDALCPSRSSRLTDSEKRIASTLLSLFEDLNSKKSLKVFVIATSNKPDSIDSAFRRCGRLDREIEIPTPSPKSRKTILEKLLESIPHNLNEEEMQAISMNTHGYVGADLVSLCSRADMNASKRGSPSVNKKDFEYAMKIVRPSAMREVQIEVPNVKWSDIGGQDNLKLILRQAVEWPLKYSESFIRLGVTPPKGVLMFGPPGCSKTMIAKALATESGLNFLSIKGPELFSKWVGESERAVREVFRKARQVAPSIIFFDEIDALGGERSSGSSTSVQERVLAQLLTELDGVTSLGDVTIVAATNRPDRIDKALMRPGRLDRIVYVPLPDSNTRREIFRIKFAKMPVLNVSIDELVEKTMQYSGAEVNAVCHEAAMAALEESLECQHVESRHFEKALKLITPRTPSSLIKLYDEFLQIKI
nr:spermatogenesis-associated protein 5 [Leptinotarsa decemlineata]